MTFPDGPNGPNPSAKMCPTQIQSGSTWIHQFGGSRAAYGQTYPIKAIIGPFGPFQSPPMTFSDGPNGPNPSARMCPTQIQSGSTWIHQFGGSGAAYGQTYPIKAIIGPFWTVPEPPNDISGWPKWPKPISQDVSHPDPVWIHLDPPVLGLQGRLWPKYPN